jgi:phosphohistidine swiveling domain-containing protein
MMPDAVHPHKIHLERRTFGELLSRPAPESVKIIKHLFSLDGPFAQAARSLGLVVDSGVANTYIHIIEGYLFVRSDKELFHVPTGLKKFHTLWQLQKHLSIFPETFYTQSAESVSDIEQRYALTALLAKLAVHRRDHIGINLDKLWHARETWIEQQGDQVLIQDIDLQHPNESKRRQTWSKPTSIADAYAILREDAKDEWRKTLPKIKATLPPSPTKELPLDIVIEDDQVSVEKTNKPQKTGQPVSLGYAEGVAVLPTNPTDNIPPNAIIIVHALTPAWDVMLNKRPLGVIAELGGPLSHGAIQCRERKIPAIFGYENARKRIQGGSNITLDANRNDIKII